MGLYNVVFGTNPLAPVLLAILDLTPGKVGRFRDAYIDGDRIAVYTRNGGGNRECWTMAFDDPDEQEKADSAACDCVGCFMSYRVKDLPHYLSDRDDEYDSTYATIWFAVPPDWVDLIRGLAGDVVETPDDRWQRVIQEMQDAPDLEALNAVLARAKQS